MLRLNTQLTRLAPAILAEAATATISFGDGIRGHAMATRAVDGTWIFAQNLDLGGKDGLGGRTGTANLALPGLTAGTVVEVVDENRTIVATDGDFTDSFAALAEHVYRIAP